MFNQLYLLSHTIFCKPESLQVNGKEVQLRAIQLNTSPIYLLKAKDWGGWRAANESELKSFAQKYKPGALLEVHGVDSNVERGYFGPAVKVFKTKPRAKVVQAKVNPIWGLPQRTLVLWIKEENTP